jgi:hypothetical protein
MANIYRYGGKTNVRHVIVLPPTRSRILPKLGTDSAMNRRMTMLADLNTQRFQLNSES